MTSLQSFMIVCGWSYIWFLIGYVLGIVVTIKENK